MFESNDFSDDSSPNRTASTATSQHGNSGGDRHASHRFGDEVLAVWRERELLELEIASTVLAWDQADGHIVDGSANASAWLKHRLGISHGQARELLWFTHGINQYSDLYAAIESGRLSSTKAKSLLRVFTTPRHEFTLRDIESLIGYAARLTVNQTRLIAKAWAARVDAELASQDPSQPTVAPVTSELFVSEILDGIVELAGTLDPSDGETFRTAMALALKIGRRDRVDDDDSDEDDGDDGVDHELFEDEANGDNRRGSKADSSDPGPVDERTAAQQRADALTLIVRFFLDHHDKTGTASGERPHINVTINLDTLENGNGLATTTHTSTGMTAQTALQHACDANIHRIITNGASEILDVGRTTRIISPSLHKAIRHRDIHCRFPGCDTPHQFGQVHHIQPWSRGGSTDRYNLVLLCTYHHRLVHHGPWQITGNPNSQLTFTNTVTHTSYRTHPPGIHQLTG